MAKILTADENSIEQAAEVIKKGGLVAFPTETVYGLGGSVFDSMAIARIFEVKNRPYFDPLIVHIQNLRDLYRLCNRVSKSVEILIDKFWPGPLTLILVKKKIVPGLVVAGLNTVAVRMPAHPVALELIKFAGLPIAAPSANLFGRLSPTTAEHVAEQIGEKIDLIIDGGKTNLGIESTVLDVTEEPTILRLGSLPLEEIENVMGKKVKVSVMDKRPRSPGQIPKHYAPKITLKIIKNGCFEVTDAMRAGFLAFKSPVKKLPFKKIEILSPKGDLREAASNLFTALHNLEKADIDIIYAEPVPEVGLGRAIMDRLYKAEGIRKE